jgi:hypothetical protein
MFNILAVAIGPPANSHWIDKPSDLTGTERPYIQGLVTYLSQQGVPGSNPPRNYTLGTDYVIDYQECWEGNENLAATDLIFCMSTPVTKKADQFTNPNHPNTFVVGIFSDPQGAGFYARQNICGVKGKRIERGHGYYKQFTQRYNTLTNVYVLERPGNPASDGSEHILKTGGPTPVTIHDLPLTTPAGQDPRPGLNGIINLINSIPANPALANATSGLLVLPVDVFFGTRDTINQTAAAINVPVFWPVTDWSNPPAIDGYGAAQADCGRFMGQQVLYIMQQQQLPPPPFRFIDLP